MDACSSGHYHCPLCGVLCVGMDTSSGGVKMHLLGCRQAPRRKMGPSMIQVIARVWTGRVNDVCIRLIESMSCQQE